MFEIKDLIYFGFDVINLTLDTIRFTNRMLNDIRFLPIHIQIYELELELENRLTNRTLILSDDDFEIEEDSDLQVENKNNNQ